MIGALVSEGDAEQFFDLSSADAHGEGGDGHLTHGGLVEWRWRVGYGYGDRRRGRIGRLEPMLDLAGVVVDGLATASGLLGLASDGTVTAGEDGGGVADDGAKR